MTPVLRVAPRPSWRDLAGSLLPARAVALRPWTPEDADGWLLARAAWGFAAVARGLAAILGRPATLWFPGYFCNASLGPARASGAALRFYPVDQRARPDWAACRRLAAAGAPDAFILVHTFGRPGGVADAAAFCEETGALLVEDAAHALAPAPGIGDRGGIVLYSPYKLLPLPHGGIVVVRRGSATEAVAAACRALPRRAAAAGPWLARRAVEKSLPAPLLRRAAAGRGQTDFDVDAVPAETADEGAAASPPARRLLARCAGRLEEIATLRQRNARFLASFAWLQGCVPLEDGGAASGVPYRFVLRCPSHEAAKDLFGRLRARGVPAESWPDLPPEVAADAKTHAAALMLRRTLLLLPVHQDLDPDILEAALREL